MTWIWMCVAAIVLLASLIVSQRRSARDLFHADPNLSRGYRVTRWVGNGLVFLAALQLMAWLWRGLVYSSWSQEWMNTVVLALIGVTIVFGLSARRGAESIK